MAFDTSRWGEPATRSELADSSITAALALYAVHKALASLKVGDQSGFDTALEMIWDKAKEFHADFDKLAGYSDGE